MTTLPGRHGAIAALMTLLAALPAAAAAEDIPLFLGPVLYHRNGPWLSRDTAAAYPTGDYEGERLLLRGDTLGVKLSGGGAVILNAVVQNDLLAYDAHQADTAALRLLDNRRDSLNGGLEAVWRPSLADELRADVLADVADRYRSGLAGITASHTFSLAGSYTQVIPRLAWTWFGAGYTRYYFGISPDESLRTGLPAFRPAAAARLDAGLTVAQPLSPDLVIFIDAVRKRFDAGIGGSPLLARTSYVESDIGILYNVKKMF
jgi:outer membrane protein